MTDLDLFLDLEDEVDIAYSDGSDDNADLIALWCLRMLVSLGGHRSAFGRFASFSDNALLAVGLVHLVDQDPDPGIIRQHLRRRLREAEQKRPELEGTLADNLAYVGDVLGLSATERHILAFAALIEVDPGLDDSGDTLGNKLTHDRLVSTLATTLGTPIGEVRQALTPRSTLLASGILLINSEPEGLRGKVDLISGFRGALLTRHEKPEFLFAEYLRPGGECRLSLTDFPHIGKDLSVLIEVAQRAVVQQQRGFNVLLYGPSGSGKTQLVRALAAALKLALFEVPTERETQDPFLAILSDGRPLGSDDRLGAYKLCQRILTRRRRSLVLFDEIEDVFPTGLRGLFHQSPPPKAWLNELLESNPVPTIWVSNAVSQLDPAHVRRFSLVIRLENPPRSVRGRILQGYLVESGVRQEWVASMAENPHLPPAAVEQIAKLAKGLNVKSADALEETLERLLGNTLEAMGLPRSVPDSVWELTRYRLDCLNPDMDPAAIAEGLRQDPRGRLCLYGPPGTGKTAFGRYLAQVLDRPLLIKRTSDLQSKWVGETEQQIAAMFREAEAEQAVLLLDEADGMLRDRSGAQRSWEVTQVNELLTQMESFDGVFIAATNLMDALDAASIRRFDLKIRFDYLCPRQSALLFAQVLEEHGCCGGIPEPVEKRLTSLDCLTPGDFATVIRRTRIVRGAWSPQTLIESLVAEHNAKPGGKSRSVGFMAAI